MSYSFVLRCVACSIIGLGSVDNLVAEKLFEDADSFSPPGSIAGRELISDSAGPQKTRAGQQINDRIYVLSRLGFADGELEIHVPDASFIKIHFSQFNLPRGVQVEISSPDGSESYRYERLKMGRHTRNALAGDDGRNRFSAMSISGDTAIVRLLGGHNLDRSLKHRLAIDYYVAGLPEDDAKQINTAPASSLENNLGGPVSKPKSQCGVDDSVSAVCYESSHPDQYDTSLAVAKILIEGGRNYCTAWRVGADNHLFTNAHCIESQTQLEASEVWFDYEYDSCDGQTTRQPIKVTGAQLVSADPALDYALFSVNDFSSIVDFGHLGIEVSEAVQGEFIYIPQHANGSPKQIALWSDMNPSGQCQIDSTESGYTGNDLGYYCDTRGGSSGSPVVLQDTNNVIALHHAGGCLNQGVKMSLIWPQVSQHFGGVVPVGSGDGGGQPTPNVLPQASFTSACTELSCNFDAAASIDPDGEVVDYHWDFGDGSQGSGVQVSKTYSGPGNHEVRLIVEDNTGDTHSVTQLVSVDEPNSAPLAAYSVDCNATLCTFDAGLSSDNDGQIVSYKWNFGDGSGARVANTVVQHNFAQDGSYVVSLTVSDDQGASGSAQSTLTVSTPVANQEPVAVYSFSCTDLSCEFNATASNDPDGTIVGYLWDFGDNESTESGGPVKPHSYAYSGVYTVTLRVEDDAGAISTQSATVNVTAPVPPVPAIPDITLTVDSEKYKGQKSALLSWSGAQEATVEIYKDDTLLATVANSGTFVEDGIPNKTRYVVYRICEPVSTRCSADLKVRF